MRWCERVSPEHMSKVLDTDGVCLLPLSLMELGLIPFPLCFLLVGPTEALSEELGNHSSFSCSARISMCCHLRAVLQRLAISVSSYKRAVPAPWQARGNMPRPWSLISMEPCVWLCCGSAKWCWSSHFAFQIASFWLLALPAYRDRPGTAVQMCDRAEVQLAPRAPQQVPVRVGRQKTEAMVEWLFRPYCVAQQRPDLYRSGLPFECSTSCY